MGVQLNIKSAEAYALAIEVAGYGTYGRNAHVGVRAKF